MNPSVRIVQILFLSLIMGVAHAQLTIEITKGVERALPIAVVPFGWQGVETPPEDMAAIISADLQRSGRFEPLAPREYVDRPADYEQINFPNWRALQVDYVVVGQVRPRDGGYVVEFQLADVLERSQLVGFSFDVRPGELRRLAHHISDLVYERITGERGAFNTRIAYVTATPRPEGSSYALMVADADGYNPQVILRSSLPVMSPAWSPDGTKLAYVSFEGRKSQIFVQDVYSGNRFAVADFPGINGAPAWSPDGRRLALTLSKDGNPEVYIYDLISRNVVTRLTNSSAIDTEPAWSPDGNSIIFTSDRGGSPQLYRVGLGGERPERLTFEGDYNAAADFSPDGRSLAIVHRTGGKFHIAVMDLNTRELRVLTRGGLDESPSFAPNGSMIIYATSQGGQGILATVSVDGRVQQNLISRDSDVREPAWSPYSR